MLGTVERAEPGRLEVRLDTASGPGQGRRVSVSMADYAAVDHGYATTIHKAQGATVDRTYVLASGTMDRHLTYVSMTRHRDEVALYAGREEFKDVDALSARLSRAGLKETTLDYAARRGIEQPIVVPIRCSGRRGRSRRRSRGRAGAQAWDVRRITLNRRAKRPSWAAFKACHPPARYGPHPCRTSPGARGGALRARPGRC